LEQAPFVGRDRELRQLQAAYEGAAAGQGSLVTVVGEPGIGKTALCEQFIRHVVDAGGLALVGHCYEEGSLSLPYLPFIEALRAHIRVRDPDLLRAELGSGAAYVARIVPETTERLGVTPPEPGNPDEDRWRLLGAVADFLRQIAIEQPLLLVLEDLHDADRGTLDLLLFVARNLKGSRLLLMGTYRDVEVDRVHPLSAALAELRRVTSLHRLVLRGLLVEDVERLLREMNVPQAGRLLAETVQHQTEGNPLFVQELGHYIVDERDATGQLPLPTSLPEGLRDVIGRRLSQLSPAANQVLAAAAVVGREFRLDVLLPLLQASEDTVEQALAEAMTAAIIEERRMLGPTAAYRFTHALFRQALYEELTAPRRIRLHQQVARALEQAFSGRLEEHASELAEHYAFSSDPTELARAVAYGELAARQAMAVFAYGEAERQLGRALEVQEILGPNDEARRCDLLLQLSAAMLPTEAPDRATRIAADPAFMLAEGAHDSLRAAQAAVLGIEGLWRVSGGPAGVSTIEFNDWVARADRHAAEGTAERVYADMWKGVYCIASGRIAEGGAFLRTALERGRILRDDEVYRTASAFGMSLLQAVRDRPLVEQLAREAYARGRVLPRVGTPNILRTEMARILVECGDRDAADQIWSEVRQLAESTAEPRMVASAHIATSKQCFLDGRLEDAIAAATLAASEPGGNRVQIGQLIGRALHYLGRGGEVDLAYFASPNRLIQAARATVLARLGRCGEASEIRARFRGIEDTADESGLHVLLDLFEASIVCGDAARADALHDRLLTLSNRVNGLNLVSIGRLLGEAAAMLGRPDDARARFEEALDLTRRVRFRPELALIRLELGELLVRHYPRERSEGVDHLKSALEGFRDMDMLPSLRHATELLDEVDAAREAGGLTPREREVADLIADGLSNRQIAEALVISEGTAEVHIKRILSKLGFRSRSQVAVWANERRRSK
jgi:DNA-binding CsgD family transcriptional regulator